MALKTPCYTQSAGAAGASRIDAEAGQARLPADKGSGSRTTGWTEADIRTLEQLWSTSDNATIARQLGRSEASIAVKACRLGLPPRPSARSGGDADAVAAPKGKVRPCLRCRTPFFSEGAHHRICDGCKSSPAWASGSGAYVYAFISNG